MLVSIGLVIVACGVAALSLEAVGTAIALFGIATVLIRAA